MLRRTKDQRIVIVEDDADVKDALESYFKDRNEIRSFASAEQALAAHENLEGTTVFIIDYNLSGINGVQLFHNLRRRFPKARYILITGEMNYDVADDTRKLGFDALMLKPFDFKILEDNISALVMNA